MQPRVYAQNSWKLSRLENWNKLDVQFLWRMSGSRSQKLIQSCLKDLCFPACWCDQFFPDTIGACPINIWDLSRDYQTQQNKHQIALLIMTSTALIAAGFNPLCGRASCWIQHFMQACLQHVWKCQKKAEISHSSWLLKFYLHRARCPHASRLIRPEPPLVYKTLILSSKHTTRPLSGAQRLFTS